MPMRPRPAIPSVLPRSSVPCSDFFSHLPACISASARHKMASHGQHHAQRLFRDCHRIRSRRIHDGDALTRGRIQIDVVDAHASAADHAQFLGMRQQRRIRPAPQSARSTRPQTPVPPRACPRADRPSEQSIPGSRSCSTADAEIFSAITIFTDALIPFLMTSLGRLHANCRRQGLDRHLTHPDTPYIPSLPRLHSWANAHGESS